MNDNMVSYNGHDKGCVCIKCGTARENVKLLNEIFERKKKK